MQLLALSCNVLGSKKVLTLVTSTKNVVLGVPKGALALSGGSTVTTRSGQNPSSSSICQSAGKSNANPYLPLLYVLSPVLWFVVNVAGGSCAVGVASKDGKER